MMEITHWTDDDKLFAIARNRGYVGNTTDHHGVLRHLHYANTGEPAPDISGVKIATDAFVNDARWLWQCEHCRAAIPVHKGEPVSICVECGIGGWRQIILPDAGQIEAIEVALGKQQHKRITHWLPIWDISYLEWRTKEAQRIIDRTGVIPRSLSIGISHIFAVGEQLTASIMNMSISDLIDDLAGRNGPIAYEGDGIILEPRSAAPNMEGALSYTASGKRFLLDLGISGVGTERVIAHLPSTGLAVGDMLVVDPNTEGGFSKIAAGSPGETLTINARGLPVWI